MRLVVRIRNSVAIVATVRNGLVFSISLCLFCWHFLSAQPVGFYPLQEVKPGLKGEGRSVFKGSTVEPFDVEILGVLPNIQGPGQSLIMAKLSGQGLEETGVFQGMSGSPVYIDGKLLGAIAYSYSFSKLPIAGITPIGEMIDVFTEKAPASFQLGRRLDPRTLYRAAELPEKPAALNLPNRIDFQDSGRLQPIATPLTLSGVLPETLSEFGARFRSLGLVPVLGAGSASSTDFPDAPLEPGSTISVQLVRGDLDINASGTVTHISGDTVYAFGHPFMGMGFTQMPFTKAAALTVIPSLMVSQKMSVSGPFVGTIQQDRATGLMGLRGVKPAMIPLHLTLHTSRNEEKRSDFEIVTDEFLTPLLTTFVVHNGILSSERTIGEQTLHINCRIALAGQPEVNFESSVSDLTSSPALAALTATAPIDFLLTSGFKDVVVENVDVEIRAVEDSSTAVLDSIWQNKLEVKAGEEVELTVFLRRPDGTTRSEKFPIKIPAGISPGPLDIVVGDGISISRSDSEAGMGSFVPEDLGQLVRAINNLKKNDRLYVRLVRRQAGAVVAGEGLPDLPPSILALYGSRKTSGGPKPLDKVVYVEHELPKTEFVLTGRQVLTLHVKG